MYMSACCFFTHRAHHLKEGQGKARMACSRDLSSVGVCRALLKSLLPAQHPYKSRDTAGSAPSQERCPGGWWSQRSEGFRLPFPSSLCLTKAHDATRDACPLAPDALSARSGPHRQGLRKATPLFFFVRFTQRTALRVSGPSSVFYAVMVKLQNHFIY